MICSQLWSRNFLICFLLQIRCYPRNSKLDNTFAVSVKVPSQILLLNTFKDTLTVFCIDSHIMLFALERKNTEPSKMSDLSFFVKSRKRVHVHIYHKHFLLCDYIGAGYVPGSNDRGHIVFVLSVCLSVCLLSTLTFAITFEPYEKETSYMACILH